MCLHDNTMITPADELLPPPNAIYELDGWENYHDTPTEKSLIPPHMAYEFDRWEDYHDTLKRHASGVGSREDFGAFLPSPDVVRERIGQMRWLGLLGFDNRFLCSIMQYDCPSIELVRRMVAKHGPQETRRRLLGMLEKTEYDKG